MIPELHGPANRAEHQQLVRDLENVAPLLDTRTAEATTAGATTAVATVARRRRVDRMIRSFRRGLASMLESAGNAIAPESVRHHETPGR